MRFLKMENEQVLQKLKLVKSMLLKGFTFVLFERGGGAGIVSTILNSKCLSVL